MNIVVVGLNHKTAPIELRERFAFSTKDIEKSLTYWQENHRSKEILILSTCNRVEIYSYGMSESYLSEWLCAEKNIPLDDELRSHIYILSGIAAVTHLMRVTCGMDSLVVGEPEIFGQIKAAFSLACLHKTIGSYLSRLFRQTFHITKKIRSTTQIGACPVSVASSAVYYAEKWLKQQKISPRVLIIGTGNVGYLAAKRAKSLTSHPMFIISRHIRNAQHIAKELCGVAVEYSELAAYIHSADIIVSATASKDFIITPELTLSINKPTLFIDLAVPRDISPDITKNPNAHLCQLDELKTVIQRHMYMRSHAAIQAEHMIEENAREFMLSLRRLTSDHIVLAYRQKMKADCEAELKKILKNKSFDDNTVSIFQTFSENLLNKIMHIPSIQLQRASVEGRDEILHSASEIFGINGYKK